MKEYTGDMAEVAAVCGDAVAEELCEKLPGISVYIPSHQEPEGLLLRLSDRTLEALIRELPGDTFYVPRRKRALKETYEAIEKLIDSGLTSAEVALELGISQNHVFRARAKSGAPKIAKRPDPKQLTFDDLL